MKNAIVPVVAAVIRNSENKILITQRPPGSHLAGLWEFPGGKIDGTETAEQALQRELKEELDVQATVEKLLWQETFTYPEKTIHIRFFQCRLKPAQKIRPLQVADFKWVAAEELNNFAFPPADKAFIEKLVKDEMISNFLLRDK